MWWWKHHIVQDFYKKTRTTGHRSGYSGLNHFFSMCLESQISNIMTWDIMAWKSLLFTHPLTNLLLQRNEARRVRGSNTRATVLDRLVCDWELPKVVANHFRLKEKNKVISQQIPEFPQPTLLNFSRTCQIQSLYMACWGSNSFFGRTKH